jgi:catechol 2,3-dioxygenase-like lactoylglutathione lyase family enzyme
MPFQVTALHHVGLTVRDIQRSYEWYTTMFGFEPAPINHGSGESLSEALQVPGTELSYSMVQLGTTRIEFLQYHEPPGKDFDRTNGDVGSSHICLEVDDIEAAVADMQAKGAVFNAPPITLDSGAFAGSTWAYVRDPDGIQLEIWQSPQE